MLCYGLSPHHCRAGLELPPGPPSPPILAARSLPVPSLPAPAIAGSIALLWASVAVFAFGCGGPEEASPRESPPLFREVSQETGLAFEHFIGAPRRAAVYNIGGGRHSNCSMREAIAMCEAIAGRELEHSYAEQNRIGDHIWWIGDNGRFARDFNQRNTTLSAGVSIARDTFDLGPGPAAR